MKLPDSDLKLIENVRTLVDKNEIQWAEWASLLSIITRQQKVLEWISDEYKSELFSEYPVHAAVKRIGEVGKSIQSILEGGGE